MRMKLTRSSFRLTVVVLLCAASLVSHSADVLQTGLLVPLSGPGLIKHLPLGDNQENESRTKAVLEVIVRPRAEQGDARSQVTLGACYQTGQGVEQDFAEAVHWYRRAAEQNLAAAQISLGYCCYKGEGVQQDFAEAVKWYRKANVAGAHYCLGYCYYKGEGIVQDYTEAAKLFRKAAEQGGGASQNALGVCYANGHGVEQDNVEAFAWYNLAAEGLKLAEKNRDDLEPKLSPQQINDAYKRTRELRAQIEARLKAGK